ncbi:hypothetical protein AJ78_04113 [Emergomyces pasteurianus Ep9510]|uniref:FAD-binding FR-type domain-containing protein n=1 Tax=Emergomyces pasteurianus Ep9510 TaxID=1447872 RepID=A0A1J9QIC4_9EURO|nr:hypothetical protein AJ78_04113 [Emergomyces pasteurianus Ep9510]
MTASIPHELRTTQEPRQNTFYNVSLSSITQANSAVRLLRLAIIGPSPAGSHKNREQQNNECESNPDKSRPFNFFPGQWLDVHVPSVPQAGGFTITSTPSDALPLGGDGDNNPAIKEPYVELAVQESPSNPPAAWLWRPQDEILGQELVVRVGGSFIWPPPDIPLDDIERVVFVAGGVGINPLISMLSYIFKNPSTLPHSPAIHLLYSTKCPTTLRHGEDISKHLDQILFFPRLRGILDSQQQKQQGDMHEGGHQILRLHLHLYITNLHEISPNPPSNFALHNRRISMLDLHEVIGGKREAVRDWGSSNGGRTVCYLCGPPDMTDKFVAGVEKVLGAGVGRDKSVFCEKWW